MNNDKIKSMEQNADSLHKLLNHKIFKEKFPEIRSVDARQFGDGIDVVFFLDDPYEYTKGYKEFGPKAATMVRDLARMAGVGQDRINIYPLIPTTWNN
jgi:hypothetical protein